MSSVAVLLAAFVALVPPEAGPPPTAQELGYPAGCVALYGGTGGVHLIKVDCPGPLIMPPNLTGETFPREAVMNLIERTIVLPKGANPFDAYARNYALSGLDKVVGVYILPMPPADLTKPGGCSMLTLPDFETRPCTKAEIEEKSAADVRAFAAQTPAAKRRWHDDARALPGMSDGGCMQVNIEYDVARQQFLKVECNGP